MIPSPGSYTFGPQNGRILVRTYREGLAKAIGHDLVIEVGEWSAYANPIEGVGGVKPLSDADKSEIKKNIRKVLTSPDISFQSFSVKVAGNSATVSGDLTIMGRSELVDVQLIESGGKIKGSFSVLQTRWGIKPFTAMMGTLKVADRVDVEFEVDLPA